MASGLEGLLFCKVDQITITSFAQWLEQALSGKKKNKFQEVRAQIFSELELIERNESFVAEEFFSCLTELILQVSLFFFFSLSTIESSFY